MKGNAQAAVTLVNVQADRLGLDPALFDDADLHIHVPAGAIPKDGPAPAWRWRPHSHRPVAANRAADWR